MRFSFTRLMLPVRSFCFRDTPTPGGKGGENKSTPPADPAPPNEPDGGNQPSAIENEIEALRTSNPKLFNTIFGRGVKKGSASGLQKEEIDAAKRLFASVNPADVDSLLKAKSDAEAARLDNAKKTEDFNTFAKELEERAKAERANVERAYKTQLETLRAQIIKSDALVVSLKDKLTKVLIVKELQTVAASKGIIDPTDAVVHLERMLKLDDNFEPIVDEAFKDKGATINDLVDNLIKAKPHLVKAAQRPGNGEPQPKGATRQIIGSEGKKVYKRSELRDPKFFKDNEEDIMAAAREGRIEDDISSKQ